MSTLDIIILVLLVLSAIWGLIRGFGKSNFKIFVIIASIACCYFFGVPAARGLMNTSIGNDWLTGLYLGNIPTGEAFSQSVVGLSSQAQQEVLSAGFAEMGFPAFFRGFFISGCVNLTSDVATAMASSFAYYTLVLAMFVLFLIVFSIVLTILFKAIAEPFLGEDGKGVLGRLLGMVKKVLTTSLSIISMMSVVVLIDSLLMNADIYALHDWLFSDLGLGSGDFSLARLFYDTASSVMSWVSQI